ncbi:MAG: hypothetical protein K5829_05150 [Treponema sp.]|nr:hypothetical protein [Treponema sp.]
MIIQKKISLFLILSLFVFSNISIFSQEKDSAKEKKFSGWKIAETDHFNFIFEEESRQSAQAYAKIADYAWNLISKYYAFPQDKTNVYVTARTNTVNAYTFFSPLEIMMFTSPVLQPDFTFREDWKRLFFTHELIHVANVDFEDKASGFWPIKVFGPAMRSLDSYSDWALEGLTTVLETELTDGGRGRSPYFELMYKAPTLDNGFISYDDVGLDEEPPYGQAYVIGYLMMRSIADRWGLKTLADIERNRDYNSDWDEAVNLVTGEEAEDIYRDVRISLAKKYSKERDIPEGLIISPRASGTFYYKPSIVLDDGTLITLRTNDSDYAAVVKLDPSAIQGSNYISSTKAKEDLNTLFRETILFSGAFSDESAITADKNGKVYASLARERIDSWPGLEIEYDLYSWTEEEGLKQVTNKTSLFQPSVSRDGKTLVAVEQYGLKMRLVKVCTESGKIEPILQSDGFDFIEPCVNEDGSKVAFLATDGHKAEIAVIELINDNSGKSFEFSHQSVNSIWDIEAFNAKNFGVIDNPNERITDPAYPSWNSDGKLLFTNNERGRLEVFEADLNSAELPSLDNNSIYKVDVRPVLADPIGALWAYKGDRGIYYWSYASSGYVIKMKPASEWAKVPAENGPSEPGQIIHFGDLQRDYPDFKPYYIPSEEEISIDRLKEKEEKKNKADEDLGSRDDEEIEDEDNEEPIPFEKKEVARRPEELKQKAFNNWDTSPSLKNERKYIPGIQPFLYSPLVWLSDFGFTEEANFGFGGIFVGLTPKLQMNIGVFIASLIYYPQINNFDAATVFTFPFGAASLDCAFERNLKNIEIQGTNFFAENNKLELGGTIPFYHRFHHVNESNLSFISGLNFSLLRYDSQTFTAAQTAKLKMNLDGELGLEFLITRKTKTDYLNSFNMTALALGHYDFDLNKFFAGLEAEFEYESGGFDYVDYGLSFCARYTDFPAASIIDSSRADYGEDNSDCSYPGRALAKFSVISDYGNIFAESGIAFGKNTVDFQTPDSGNPLNLTYDKSMALGYEYVFGSGLTKIGFAYKYKFYFEDSSKNEGEFAINLKYNWLRR